MRRGFDSTDAHQLIVRNLPAYIGWQEVKDVFKEFGASGMTAGAISVSRLIQGLCAVVCCVNQGRACMFAWARTGPLWCTWLRTTLRKMRSVCRWLACWRACRWRVLCAHTCVPTAPYTEALHESMLFGHTLNVQWRLNEQNGSQ